MSESMRAGLVACFLASILAFDYSIAKVDQHTREQRTLLHQQIARGSAEAPFRYRVLVVYAADVVIRVASAVMPAEAAFTRVYAVYYFLALAGLLVLLHYYLRGWFDERVALIGVALVAGTLPISLRQHYFAPWSLLEPSFLLAALMLLRKQSYAALLPLTILATLNRETGLLLAVAAAVEGVFNREHRKALSWAIVMAAAAVSVILALRWWLGSAPETITLDQIWRINSSREGLLSAIGNVLLFAGVVGWLLIARGLLRLPPFVRRQLWTAAVYLPLYAIWGIWYEVRLLMPLYPVLVPALLCGLFELNEARPRSS